jgi:hypothetical protein
MDDRGIGVRLTVGTRQISLLHSFQTGFETHWDSSVYLNFIVWAVVAWAAKVTTHFHFLSEAKNVWSCTSCHAYCFMSRYLFKRIDMFLDTSFSARFQIFCNSILQLLLWFVIIVCQPTPWRRVPNWLPSYI